MPPPTVFCPGSVAGLLRVFRALGALAFTCFTAHGVLAGEGTPAPDSIFNDPCPPQVSELSAPTIPAPQPNPDIQFHNPPKTLAKGARVRDWRLFLGPNHNGTCEETHLLKDLPHEGPPLVWEMPKGESYASPAIAEGRLIFFHRLANEEVIECLHPETGERYWRVAYPTDYKDRYGYNDGPRASPIVDEEDHVYTLGAEGVLSCIHLLTGHLFWQRDLLSEFKIPQDFFGVAATPLIEGNSLIVNLGAPGGPCVAAFERASGKLTWGAGHEWGPSCSAPIPAVFHGKRRVLVFAGGESRPPVGGLLSVDPVGGTIDFQFPWRSQSVESVNASRPVVVGNRVFISASYQTGGAMLEVQPDGSAKLLWTTQDLGTHFMTSIHKDGFLYGFDGRNEQDASLVCLDWNTGKLHWRKVLEWEEEVEWRGKKRTIRRGTFRGALVEAEGKFLCLGELGSLQWLDLSPNGCREISRAKLFEAPESWTPPVISHGLLYICRNYQDLLTDKPPRLLCYDLRAPD